jgi:hypothetical protein
MLVEIGAAQKIAAGAADEFATAVLQARGTGRTPHLVMFGVERAAGISFRLLRGDNLGGLGSGHTVKPNALSGFFNRPVTTAEHRMRYVR